MRFLERMQIMTVENYTDQERIFEDRFGLRYRMLGQILSDIGGNYIIYEDPKDSLKYIEEVVGTPDNSLLSILQYEVKQIDDDRLFMELFQLAIKEGILSPVQTYEKDEYSNTENSGDVLTREEDS